MRSMTTKQARNYIKAGYFPERRESDLAAICDLQDVFGHLPYRFALSLLADDELAENTERLYRLIWNGEEVDRYVNQGRQHRANLKEREELTKRLAELDRSIRSFEYNDAE